jgi:hypothetical protein
LYEIFTNLDAKAVFGDILPQQCLGNLLKLFNHFFGGRFPTAALLADKFMKYDVTIERLIHLLYACVTTPLSSDPAAEAVSQQTQVQVTHQILILLLNSLYRYPATLSVLYSFKQWPTLIETAFTKSPLPQLRDIFKNGLEALCNKFDTVSQEQVPKHPRTFLLPLLLKTVSQVDEKSSCTELFVLVQSLLKAARFDTALAQAAGIEPAQLAATLVAKIKKHKILEMRAGDNDHVLRGLLSLTHEILRQVPSIKEDVGQKQGLVKEVFYHCLFETPTPESRSKCPPPKCKSRLSRRIAYALLVELTRTCPANYSELLSLILPLHRPPNYGARGEWEYEAKSEEKSETGYVGLKNLGCTCYMNSLMQQLYMVPKLRSNLLTVEEKPEERGDSFFFQLQYIMAFLQESEKQFYNPMGFCQTFRDWSVFSLLSCFLAPSSFFSLIFFSLPLLFSCQGGPSHPNLRANGLPRVLEYVIR